MTRELELVRAGMAKADFSEGLYAPALNAVESALSPLLLPATWNQVRSNLSTETLLALGFCSEILPDEESEIPLVELQAIEGLVAELEGLLRNSSLPPRLQAVLRHHVELMRQALAEYPIAGAKALREAARSGLGELVEVREAVVENNKSAEVSKLAQAWKQLNTAADAALKADKLLQLGQRAWHLVEGMFQSGA